MGEPRIPKIAVIGCGYWGQNLVRDFAGLGALAAVCDADSQKLEKLVVDAAVMKTPRFEDVLERRDIEAVVIAAPAAQHFALAKKALLAGKDAFVEKPLALHLEEGKELVELAQKRGRILMVGHLLHYHPAINELRRMLHSGELGRVEYISSSRLNLGKLRTEEDILWSFAPTISPQFYIYWKKPRRAWSRRAQAT